MRASAHVYDCAEKKVSMLIYATSPRFAGAFVHESARESVRTLASSVRARVYVAWKRVFERRMYDF